MVASSNTPFARASLPRCPLIPDELAKKHNVHFEIDTRFRKAARLLQALWLQDHNIETGTDDEQWITLTVSKRL
jgi:hypothetical protein